MFGESSTFRQAFMKKSIMGDKLAYSKDKQFMWLGLCGGSKGGQDGTIIHYAENFILKDSSLSQPT